MPSTLGVTYLVVILNATVTGIASTGMKCYIKCSKKVSEYALRKRFPVFKGGFAKIPAASIT